MEKKKIIGIIQASMCSKRLPRKTLADISGKPLIWHVINRVKASKAINDLVLAITTGKEDDELEDFAKNNKINVFRWESKEVLEEFYLIAKKYNADIIVRITADDPFKDPVVIDKIVAEFFEKNADYVSNTIKPTYPEGIDIEVFSFQALEKAYKGAENPIAKEHVTFYIYKNPSKFKLINVENDKDLSHLRWTVDYEQDLKFAREIYKRLYHPDKIFLMEDILRLLEKEPQLSEINKGIVRNEALKKSLERQKNE